MARRSRAEDAAIDVLDRYKAGEPPIDVDAIALAEGIEIVRTAAQGNESGFALRDGKRRIIGVNSGHSLLRQRFTVAHELGHLILHPGKPLIMDPSVRVNRRNETSSLGTDFEEIQANTFAAQLLMPRSIVARLAADLATAGHSHEQLIKALAQSFSVSRDAMTYRLINLGILSA